VRLPRAFIRLPFDVDADHLAAEVATLDDAVWKAHPDKVAGNTAVPLVAAQGDPGNDDTFGPMLPTPYLEQLPYTRRVFAALDSVIGRSRLMRIEEEHDLYEHVDIAHYWREHLRVHVPVVSDPSVEFWCGGETVHMAPGEVWVFDTWRRHKVINPANHSRIHLVIDTVGSANLWNAIANPDRPPTVVAPDAPEPALVIEQVNRPPVISPWEMELAFAALIRDLEDVPDETVNRLRGTFSLVIRAWRNAWARFGDAPEGLPTYTTLRDQAMEALANAGGKITLPNGAGFLQAVSEHALIAQPRAGVQPQPAAQPQVAAQPTRRPIRPPSIEQPVFIVSSPRSGSSLLFETLARSPDLYTVGGESHLVIEGIPELRPARRGWDSNRLDASDATPKVVAELRRRFLPELRNRDGQRLLGGPARMLEKTPKNALRIPFLAAAFPDARFIYLYRDPRETVSSMLDAWRSGRFVMYADLPDWTGDPWSLLLVPGWRDLIGCPTGEVVAKQWAIATTTLLDDLEDLEADQWCVTSYDRVVADPQAEMERLAEFCAVRWDVDLTDPLPLSRHTLDSPHPDKWLRNADELEQYWDEISGVAERAHDVFAVPPRTEPVAPRVTARAPVREAAEPASAPVEVVQGDEAFASNHTKSFAQILESIPGSLVVTTYQSGRVIVVRSNQGELNTHFRMLPSPMGIAVDGAKLAIGTRAGVQTFLNQPAVVARLEPAGLHDACYMPRHTYTTGDIRIHDLAYANGELWVANTRFSCLATLDEDHSFVPRWRPPFVSALAPEDRCHLNGLCVIDGEPKYVTALGVTDAPGGWRDHKIDGGVLIDVQSGEIVSDGMCMPHSPRWHNDRLWLLESGRGVLSTVDVATGARKEVASVPGFARGLGFCGPFAFIGLSKVREHVFDGLPLTGEGVQNNCGVWVVDTRSGEIVAWLQFVGLVEEIFEVVVLPGVRYPEMVEPNAEISDSAFILPDDALAEVPAELHS
jgi:uncharacterized protein (TIGR03032 family)